MKILVVQAEEEKSKILFEILEQFDDTTVSVSYANTARKLLRRTKPDIAIIDLHIPQNHLISLLKYVQESGTKTKIICSTRYPDLSRELEVKEYGVTVFLRAPYNKSRVVQALNTLEQENEEGILSSRIIQTSLPSVRVPVRFKIILPYLLLALLLAMGAGYVVSQVALDAIEERFVNNLIEVGRLTSAWLVEDENNRLATLRLVTFTDGLAEAVENENAEKLRELTLGIAINNQEDAIEILNPEGITVVSLRHEQNGDREAYQYSKDDSTFSTYEFVQKVLEQQADSQGDKFSGLVLAPFGDAFYIASPIYNNENQFVGATLVGKYIQHLVFDTRENILGQENSFAHVSLYSLEGELLSTTLFEPTTINIPSTLAQEIINRQDTDSHIRSISVSGLEYREILGPWEVRGGEDIGLVGVSLAETFLVRPSQVTQVQIFLIASLGFMLIIITGVILASRITRPLKRVVTAASQVSQGRWDVNVEPQGTDELAYLAHAFNYMISHLREGEIYRDLLGRTITPQVRDQLRSGLASGNLKLEGQNTIATLMITDIRKFTVISENQTPTKVLSWLNQYYGELVPIINTYDGVTNEFVGDSIMAFFGILPTAQEPSESANQACKAAVEIINSISILNQDRRNRDEPPLVTGIGINTGVVAAGGMGTADRLHYAVIGDTVNVTQRIENLTRNIGETSAIISQSTYDALGSYRENYTFVALGSHILRGKSEPINVYRLLPLNHEK